MKHHGLTRDHVRTVRLQPYRRGCGPRFQLSIFDTGKFDSRGCSVLAYALKQHEGGRASVLFEGSDFRPSPLHADDSDATVAALLGFLTLRPGDTDREYFEDYTPAQLEFCAQHAEALGAESFYRFGEG